MRRMLLLMALAASGVPLNSARAEVDDSDGDTATLRVYVPPDATVYINGQRLRGYGSPAIFDTRVLQPGHRYSYTVEAEVERNGRLYTDRVLVRAQAGKEYDVTMDLPERRVAAYDSGPAYSSGYYAPSSPYPSYAPDGESYYPNGGSYSYPSGASSGYYQGGGYSQGGGYAPGGSYAGGFSNGTGGSTGFTQPRGPSSNIPGAYAQTPGGQVLYYGPGSRTPSVIGQSPRYPSMGGGGRRSH